MRASTVAVARTTATLLLNAAGVTGARAPAVPLNADNKAERSRIRFKRELLPVPGRGCIGPVGANVQSKWYHLLAGVTGGGMAGAPGVVGGGGGVSSFHVPDDLHWLITGLFFLSRGGVKRPLAII